MEQIECLTAKKSIFFPKSSFSGSINQNLRSLCSNKRRLKEDKQVLQKRSVWIGFLRLRDLDIHLISQNLRQEQAEAFDTWAAGEQTGRAQSRTSIAGIQLEKNQKTFLPKVAFNWKKSITNPTKEEPSRVSAGENYRPESPPPLPCNPHKRQQLPTLLPCVLKKGGVLTYHTRLEPLYFSVTVPKKTH